MMNAYIALDYSDLLIGALLIVLDAALSVYLRLGLARQLLVSGVRMVVQLGLMGMVLTTLFATASPVLTSIAVIVMLGFAGYEIAARQDRPLSGMWNWGLGIGSMTLSTCLVTALALTTALRPDPWYAPHYAIPVLGMILGNTKW